MGHAVTGLIASPETLQSFARAHKLHEPIPLEQGVALLPLRDEDIDLFISPPQTGWVGGFNYLSEQLIQKLSDASSEGPVLYFETEYFGGIGSQGAAVFNSGAIAFGPKSSEGGAINDALAFLGVQVAPGSFDAFESVGLHRHRHTEDWLESEA